MNRLAGYKPSIDSNPRCADLMTMAERELSAFFNAVTQLFGAEQAERSAEEWLHELIESEGLPTSAREWRLITAKASTQLAGRVSASSLLSSALTQPQVA
jgi:hypothetical protein